MGGSLSQVSPRAGMRINGEFDSSIPTDATWMLTARRVQKPHDPVVLHAFQLSRVLISYPENF